MTSTCWSPFPVPRSFGAPFPRNRKIVPDCVPAGVIFGSTIESDNEEDFAIVSCSVTPGFEYEDFKLYTQEELLEKYPKHEGIIRRLAVASK